MQYNINIENMTIYADFIKTFFLVFFTNYIWYKISNEKERLYEKFLWDFIGVLFITICVFLIKNSINFFISRALLVFGLGWLNSKRTNSGLGYSILVSTISLSIDYILLCIAIFITFIINIIYPIESDVFNSILMTLMEVIMLYGINKIKRIKNGISFLNKKSKNEYLDLIILDISVIICFSFIIFTNVEENINITKSLFIGFMIFIVIVFITIKKSIQLYYKQKLMIKELNETKSDLEKAKQEIQTLEKENIELSKKNHSFKHQYKSLKHKVDEINKGNNANEETDLNKELDNLSKDIYIAPKNTELSKTGIVEIDDMLNCMKSECDENNINFNLQIIGNIYYMINNLISKEELEILLADHIKDAIIAIKHSDNVNKSILVKLGKIEDFYGLYIYDSGIEFEKETLENLGKRPITTHIDEGGSGMGFMNTFDTLKKNNASLIINQIGKPSKDNFTKVLEFRFDGKNEFKVLDAKN